MKVNTTTGPLQTLIDSGYKTTMTYAEYRLMVHKLNELGKVTGPKQTPALLEYSKLNEQRMNRLDKHFVVREDIAKLLQGIRKKYTWLVITEGWCGDAAQLLPMLERMTFLNLNISSRYLLRDENPELMDCYVTGIKRSIPIVICINDQHEELWHWGSRPKEGQKVKDDALKNGADAAEAREELHSWYAQNKGASFQDEIAKLLRRM
ncbi:MAG: thioredoxin family protein [Flavobacteriales bacterium]